MVKLAAARANVDCGQIRKEVLAGMEKACKEIIEGQAPRRVPPRRVPGRRRHLHEHERERGDREPRPRAHGARKGEYKHCDPHDHVNCSQSTNDAYPTALHVGMALGNVQLVAAITELIAAFRAKGQEFASILKMGRTQLQDAVPMMLGQEFEAFAETLAGEVQALERPARAPRNEHGRDRDRHRPQRAQGYAQKCTEHLAKITGSPIGSPRT